jgi:MYXO-CTERM domain-containing protein
VRELALLLGGRYRIGVTAIGGDGSGVEVLSDGVTVVDRSPPTVTVRVSRPSFAPRALETVDLTVEVTDRTGLTRTHAELRDAQGAVVRVIDDYEARVRDASRTARVTWGGTDGRGVVAPEGEYTLVATATDVGGMMATQQATVRIVAPPEGVPRGFAPPTEGGCGCGVVGSDARRGWVGLLMVLATIARRRRRYGPSFGRPSSSRMTRSC